MITAGENEREAGDLNQLRRYLSQTEQFRYVSQGKCPCEDNRYSVPGLLITRHKSSMTSRFAKFALQRRGNTTYQ